MTPVKLICVAGARPNFMKLAPLMSALGKDNRFQAVLVHTGQHYDARMSDQFFRDLGLKDPDHHLSVGSGSHAQQTAEIMKRFEPVVLAENPHGVLVVGDVNSTVACAMVAAKLQIPVIHAEAGLRSFDRSMPEEINRLVTDSISDLLLVTEESGRRNLLHEGVSPERIHMVGNLMIDSLRRHLEEARQCGIQSKLGLEGSRYGLITLHRPANVDDPEQLSGIMGALSRIAQDVPLLFPVHPRTQSRVGAMAPGLLDNIRLIEPLGYVEFLGLMASSEVVLTDSGGIQEETTALGVPCLTLRENTERPATTEEGSNILAGTSPRTILAAWEKMRANPVRGRIPQYWDGQAAGRCVEVLGQCYSAGGLLDRSVSERA